MTTTARKPQALSPDEKASARAIRAAMRPKLNPDAMREASIASLETHGEDRHNVIKWHAMHARAEQLA